MRFIEIDQKYWLDWWLDCQHGILLEGQCKEQRLLVETVGDPFPIRVAQMPKDKPIPIDPEIQGEVFACHDVSWWERRTIRSPEGENTPMDLRIDSGFLQFQTPENA